MPSLLFTVGLAAVAGVTLCAMLARRRQIGSVRSLSREWHLNYSAEDLIGLHERYYDLNLIRQGHRRQVSHILHGVTPEGLVSLFCYRYDLGFGVNQTGRQWWMAVVETPKARSAWIACPADRQFATLTAPYPYTGKVAGFMVRREGGGDGEGADLADLERILKDVPACGCAEVRQRLVAIALPFRPDSETPRQALTVVRRLAGQIEHLEAKE
ncbi:MAG: hypothetical protein KA354_16820 [Phycisphaerae bacterium]|nr:hypothetical protein [Phycisphaerae bacterium]